MSQASSTSIATGLTGLLSAAMLVVRFASNFANSVRAAVFTRIFDIEVASRRDSPREEELAFAQCLVALTLMKRYLRLRKAKVPAWGWCQR